MSLRNLTLALTALAAHCLVAAAQNPVPQTGGSVYRLRNAAASDAATAVSRLVDQQKLAVAVIAEPLSNTVLVSGEPAPRQKVLDMLAALDREPARVVARMTILRAPAGFAESVGLGEATESKWLVTPREARMLEAAVRRGPGCEILSRPNVMTLDNQTAVVNVGDERRSVATRITPRVAADGASVLLRLESEVAESTEDGETPTKSVQSVQATGSVPAAGGTLVIRGPRSNAAGGPSEIFIVVNAGKVNPPVGE